MTSDQWLTFGSVAMFCLLAVVAVLFQRPGRKIRFDLRGVEASADSAPSAKIEQVKAGGNANLRATGDTSANNSEVGGDLNLTSGE